MKHATKSVSLASADVSFAGERTFEAYASRFNSVDTYRDTIAPGAYAKTLRSNPAPLFLHEHDWSSIPVGRWVELREDDVGLRVKGELTPGLRIADDLYAALKHGTISGLSVGGLIAASDCEHDEATDVRTIRHWTDLREISLVNFPADAGAKVALETVKSAIAGMNTLSDLERFLRDAGGFSKSAATAIVGRARSLLDRRDAADEVAAKQQAEELSALVLRMRTMRLG